MITPPKFPANASPPPLMRTIATPRSGTAPPEATKREPVLTAENVEFCQQLFDEPKEYIDDAARHPAQWPR